MSMDTFVADVTARYPVVEIVLFGSRARGTAQSASDWDIVVLLAPGQPTSGLLSDTGLQRHFGDQFLDLFTVNEQGQWDYPPWTLSKAGHRGWFPESWRDEIKLDAKRVWPM